MPSISSIMGRRDRSQRFSREIADLHRDCFHLQRDWIYLNESLPQMDVTCHRKKAYAKKLRVKYEVDPCYALKSEADFAADECEEYHWRRDAIRKDLANIERAYDKAAAKLHRHEMIKMEADLATRTQQLQNSEDECRKERTGARALIARLKARLLESNLKNVDLEEDVEGPVQARHQQGLEALGVVEEVKSSSSTPACSQADVESLTEELKQSRQQADTLRSQVDFLGREGAAVDEQVEHLEGMVERASETISKAEAAFAQQEKDLIKARKTIDRLSARLRTEWTDGKRT